MGHEECGHEHDHKHGIRGHHHEYSTETREDKKRLLLCIVANFAYGALQFVVGFMLLGSMILATDAIHNASDAFSLGVPLLVIWTATRSRKTSDFLTWINYLALIGMLLLAAGESLRRVFTPENATGALVEVVVLPIIHREVNPGIVMALLAAVGIGVNLFSVIVLSASRDHDLNMKSAFMHQFADLIASIIAVVASIAIAISGQRMIDPVLTIGASMLLIWMVWPNFIASLHQWRGSKKGNESH